VQRASDTANRLKERGEGSWKRLQAGRSRSAAVDVALGSLEHDAAVGGGLLAGAVAFRVFLFIVPFVFFFVAGFGLAADATGKSARSLASDAGIAGLLATSINNMADQSFWSRVAVCLVAGFATLVGARSLLKVITVVHVLVWRLPRVRVGAKRQVLFTLGLIGVIAGAMLFVRLTGELRDVSFPAWVFATAAATALPAAIWLYVSMRVFPHPAEATWRDLLPGALLVGVGIECVHVFTVVWISRSFGRRMARSAARWRCCCGPSSSVGSSPGRRSSTRWRGGARTARPPRRPCRRRRSARRPRRSRLPCPLRHLGRPDPRHRRRPHLRRRRRERLGRA
jgi:uncharacterized BrkB/YihY/UPF0761 family membrane protein